MEVSPIDVQKHLSGVSYPASRDELVATAEGSGAPIEIVERLRALEQDEFESPAEVMEALGSS
jgi:hypothetical protein